MNKSPDKKLFSNFPKTSQKEWRSKIEKDLKGRAIEELYWELEKEIQVNPFVTIDQQEKINFSIPNAKNDNDWDIMEEVIVNDRTKNNEQILSALNGGANGIRLILAKSFEASTLSLLLKEVRLDFITLALSGEGFLENFQKCINNVRNIIDTHHLDPKSCKGYLEFDPIENNTPTTDWLNLVAFTKEKLPAFRPLTINGAVFFKHDYSTVEELAMSIAKANECLLALKNEHTLIQFSLSIGKSYFVNIAKIRALKLLWANLLKANKQVPTVPKIVARLVQIDPIVDANTLKIQLTTQAMSATLAGVDALSIDVGNFENRNFDMSLARNLQHILKLESYFDRVIDPAAGSYYLEQLSNIFANNAWSLFQEIEAKGGYIKKEAIR